MGLFSFLKNMGHEAADEKHLKESLEQAVTKAGLNLKDFQIDLKDGQAILSGTAGSMKDMELARLIVGNFKGVEKVNDDNVKLSPAATATAQSSSTPTATGAVKMESHQPAKLVTVKKGDTLSLIAKEYLGDASLYPQIVEANRPMIKNPDEIFPGQVIRIPPAQSSSTSAHV